MAITINTNVPSLVAQNKLNRNNNLLQKAMNQLSTGARINNAADDAAGLAIAEKLKFQISGSNKAMDNIADAKNFINTAEGSMITVADHLQRINELLVQGASDLNDKENGRKAIMIEIKQRLIDIDNIANSANFNGQKLLDGGLKKMVIQIGGSYETTTNTIDIQPALTDCNLTALGRTSTGAGGKGLELPECLDPDHANFGEETAIETYAGSGMAFGDAFREYMKDVQHSINVISSARGLLGAYTNRMEATYDNLANTVENLETAKSRLTDVDIAEASSDMVKYQIL
ncbi:flagellin, partial [bacterium]|nr:flagellin [bacterium]